MTTKPMSTLAPSRSAMLASTSAVQAMIGAPALTAATPSRRATIFSLTSALIGAV